MADNTVVVVGGGVTGLTAARTLTVAAPQGTRIVVLESSERLGGKLHTEDFEGVQIEAGADSFLAREREALHLCTELGLRDELVAPAIFGGLTWDGKRLRSLPAGTVMGIPTSASAVLGARILSPAGRLRALGDLVLPGRLRGNDISVAELVRSRFGSEVLERLVDPLLAGTRAGSPSEMSLRAALPQVDRAARAHSSVILGLRRARHMETPAHPLFFTPQRGMFRLIEALRNSLGDAEVHIGRPASRVTPGRRSRYYVDTEDGDRLEASAVILAVPAPAASELLGELSGPAAAGLARIRHASVAVVTLVFESGAIRFPPGSSGMLVPSKDTRLLSAATWWSQKWPHAVPGGEEVVRAFVGRNDRHPALQRPDAELVDAATEEINSILSAAGGEAATSPTVAPLRSRVFRWTDGLPQYEVGHSGRVSRIEGALEPHRGIVLAGADYRGSGIPDCIRQGIDAARRVAAWL